MQAPLHRTKVLCRFFSRRNKSTATSKTSLLQNAELFEQPVIPFASPKIGYFFQEKPRLGNQYTEDVTLKSYLKRHIPKNVYRDIEPDLERFGERVATDIYDLGLQCDIELPKVEHYDAWGKRVDKLITCPAWKKMHDISAEEGLVAIAYERKHNEWSRVHQMAKIYLYAPSAGLYSCPVAMTDGAVKIIEAFSDDAPWLRDKAYGHLTSRTSEKFWTSGQWMTERKGGSDVANGTETLAVPQTDGSYKLYGYKWFSSATDADMTFTLARVVDDFGQTLKGTKGLSLFYLETRNEDGQLNNIYIQKLKNKLGTRQVPTAELLLDGSVAYRVSEEGRGVAGISNMLTISRIHNALSAVGAMRRITNLARDYSTRRGAFGKIIKDYPLHMQTLARMEVEVRGATLLTLEIARLLGREDTGIATEQEKLLTRLLTPLAKLYTGKQAMSVVSEGVECFGGQGYIEDTGIPAILRDSQVLSIWEGTTNVLSMDVLRAVAKSNGQVFTALSQDVQSRIAKISNVELAPCVDKINKSLKIILDYALKNQNHLDLAARDFAFNLTQIYIGCLMVEHAAFTGMNSDVYASQRWCEKDLCLLSTHGETGHYDSHAVDNNFQLVFDGYTNKDRL